MRPLILSVVLLFFPLSGTLQAEEAKPPSSSGQALVEEEKKDPPKKKKRSKQAEKKAQSRFNKGETRQGTKAPNRFKDTTVQKSLYRLNGVPLEVDPD